MEISATELYDFERLVDLVRQDHPSLATLPLAPDGKYQTRPLTLDALTRAIAEHAARSFRGFAAEDFPTLYCGWGKARVGSTALNNLFGLAGIPSFYQPMKAMLRHVVTESEPTPWPLQRSAVHGRIFSKETAGPYLAAECLFIALQALIEAGYPAAKLHLVRFDRDPAASLASWISKWSDRIAIGRILRNYVIAALNAVRVEAYARRQGVRVTRYVYEASKDEIGSVRALFQRLGIGEAFRIDAVTRWEETGQLDTEKARIIFPPEPEVYFVPNVHGSDCAYRYRERDTSCITAEVLELLERTGVLAVYDAAKQGCAADLGLDAARAKRLLGIVAEPVVSAA